MRVGMRFFFPPSRAREDLREGVRKSESREEHAFRQVMSTRNNNSSRPFAVAQDFHLQG